MHSDCVHLVLEVVINNNGTTGVSPAFPLGFFSREGPNPIGLPHFPLGPHNGGCGDSTKNLLLSLPPIALPWYHI